MATRKVRVKKLAPKTVLSVYREDQIDHNEFEAITHENQIATGVEQAEENEYHLQTILKEAGMSNEQEIPVPPPEESTIDFDRLYPSTFRGPQTYIKFSQTVEECVTCQYDMLPEDDEYLKQYNAKKSVAEALSEDGFEKIMEVFEETASAQTPYASVDNTVVAYDMMLPSFQQLRSVAVLMPHAKSVYEYWKARRLEAGNKSLHPSLKFETHQDTDDMDPYVCFRRREARQTRKTRARDNNTAAALKRLRRELEEGRQLIKLSLDRETRKRDLIRSERAVFEQRQRLKAIKVRLGVKGDDEDLINQKVGCASPEDFSRSKLTTPKPQKRKAAEVPALQRPPGSQLRLTTRSDGRAMDADMVLLEDRQAEKENELRRDLDSKVHFHRKWNHDWVDVTRGPLSPVRDQTSEISFRPAKTQYLMTPPASSSDSMDIDEPETPPVVEKPVFQFTAGKEVAGPPRQPGYRRRIGRMGRLWIDKRELASHAPTNPGAESSDRWRYDSDEDDYYPPVYDVDPFNTTALRFRASIPLPSFLWKRPKDPASDASREASHHSTQALPAPPTQNGVPPSVPARSQVPTPVRPVR